MKTRKLSMREKQAIMKLRKDEKSEALHKNWPYWKNKEITGVLSKRRWMSHSKNRWQKIMRTQNTTFSDTTNDIHGSGQSYHNPAFNKVLWSDDTKTSPQQSGGKAKVYTNCIIWCSYCKQGTCKQINVIYYQTVCSLVLYSSLNLKLKCLHCIVEPNKLVLPFQYFCRGLYTMFLGRRKLLVNFYSFCWW